MRRLFFATHASGVPLFGTHASGVPQPEIIDLIQGLRSRVGQQTGQSAVHALHADAFEVVTIGIVVFGHVNRFDLSGNRRNIHQRQLTCRGNSAC